MHPFFFSRLLIHTASGIYTKDVYYERNVLLANNSISIKKSKYKCQKEIYWPFEYFIYSLMV